MFDGEQQIRLVSTNLCIECALNRCVGRQSSLKESVNPNDYESNTWDSGLTIVELFRPTSVSHLQVEILS